MDEKIKQELRRRLLDEEHLFSSMAGAPISEFNLEAKLRAQKIEEELPQVEAYRIKAMKKNATSEAGEFESIGKGMQACAAYLNVFAEAGTTVTFEAAQKFVMGIGSMQDLADSKIERTLARRILETIKSIIIVMKLVSIQAEIDVISTWQLNFVIFVQRIIPHLQSIFLGANVEELNEVADLFQQLSVYTQRIRDRAVAHTYKL